MKLERLEIRRLDGLDGAFALEGLGPGVNVVLGPNTIGKSSLGRAFLALLRPTRGDGHPSLCAVLSGPGGTWRVERNHEPQAHWTRDGAPVSPPPLLEPELLVGLVIRNEDLAGRARDEFDSGLTQRIARELAGGFDLGRLRELDGLREGPQAGGKERRELEQARNARRAVENAHAELRQREDSLDGLRRERDAARAAQTELGRVEAALELVELRRRADEASARLNTFPRELENLAARDAERLERLEKKLEDTRTASRSAQEALRAAARELEESGLDGRPVSARSVEELRARLAQLQQTCGELAKARDAEAQAAAQLEHAQQAVGARRARPARAISPEDVARVRDALQALLDLRAKEHAAQAQLDGLSAATPDVQRARLVRRALDALEDWLRAPRSAAASERRAPWLLALLAVAGISLAIFAEHALVKVLGLALLTLGTWVFWKLRPAGDSEADGAMRAQRDFEGLALEPPASWEPAAVRELHAALLEEQAAAEHDSLEHGRRRQVEDALARARAEIERVLGGLGARATELGFDPRHLDASLLRWLDLLRQHDETLARLAAAEATCETLEQTAEGLGATLAAALAALDLVSSTERDPQALEACVGELRERVVNRDRALAARRSAQEELARSEETIRELETELAGLYRAAGLEPGERAELLRRIGMLPAFDGARQAARDAANQADALERKLSKDTERVPADEPTGLEMRRTELEQRAARYDELSRRIAGIEKELELARVGVQLERALDAERVAEEALSKCHEGQLVAAAGKFLLERVESGHRGQRTGALARAEQWFARFTHHRYELVVEGGEPLELRARDVRMGELRSLEKLSTATRVQLLLAVRLAFLEEAERGRETLPLFLDEVLATSDPERSQQVMETVAELARAGRQVLYLTAQPEEAARWRAILGGDAWVHDLGAIRAGAAAAALPELLALPAPEPIPSPAGLTAAEYARALGVPALDPWRPDALHPYHLLGERLELLHELARLRVVSLAQLERLLENTDATALLDTAEREELFLRCAVARTALDAWQRGRSRPVAPEVIAASDAISDKYRGPVLALLAEVGGDARALVEAMEDKQRRPPGFRENKLNELRTELERLGLLPDEPILTPGEVRLRALATAAGRGRDAASLEGGWLDVLLARLAACARDAAALAQA